jgi:hypothetical protein
MENTSNFSKWLHRLICVGIVSLINSAASYIPFVHAGLTTWVSRGIMAATVLCMLRLSPRNGRYKKAGFFRALMLTCALITSFLFGSYLLSIAASLFSFVAVYQEYTAHAEVVEEADAVLSRKWHKLFYWELIAAVLLSFGSSLVALLFVSSALQDASRISGIVISLLKLPQFVLHVIRLLYLNKTLAYVASQEA